MLPFTHSFATFLSSLITSCFTHLLRSIPLSNAYIYVFTLPLCLLPSVFSLANGFLISVPSFSSPVSSLTFFAFMRFTPPCFSHPPSCRLYPHYPPFLSLIHLHFPPLPYSPASPKAGEHGVWMQLDWRRGGVAGVVPAGCLLPLFQGPQLGVVLHQECSAAGRSSSKEPQNHALCFVSGISGINCIFNFFI